MTGIVLAGGVSDRMRVAKALLRADGEAFLERAAGLLGRLCRHVIVAADASLELPPLGGCTITRDEQPGLGPLGGLTTALAASDDDWHLALACDLPLTRTEVLRLLAAQTEDADAVVPRVAGRLQPLLAAYARACLEPARQVLTSGKRAVAAMLDRVNVKLIEEHELRAADPDLVSFYNVNTWDQYESLRRKEADEGC